jgi:hypothetical protein
MQVTEQEDTKPRTTPAPSKVRDEFLATARKRFKIVADAERTLRTKMLEDLKFRASEQWPDSIKTQRDADGRPCLTVNRLPQFIKQITNQQRESKPAPVVSPVDGEADLKTAEVLQGMVRHIEQRSQAQVAYATAGDHQATMGRGYLRILAEYATETDDELSLVIKRVRNPFTIYMDPGCQELDYSDALYGFVVIDLTVDEFNEKYGRVEFASLNDFASIGDDRQYWIEGNRIRVAEYWYVEFADDVLLTLADPGKTRIMQSAIPKDRLMLGPKGEPQAVMVETDLIPVAKFRDTSRRQVKWATINGIAVLDGNEAKTAGREWPGYWIPIIPVIGDQIDINGDVDLRGIVRDAKDPQRRYNYQVSSATETDALQPKAPYVATVGQIAGYEQMWKTANVRNYSVLPYNPVSEAGHLVGPPQRQSHSADLSSSALLIQQADNDLKAVTGYYDASLGAPGPEQSGKAILARQKQGNLGNFNYQDNFAVAIATVGRYLVDLIPKIYSEARIVRVLGLDEREKNVMVHAGQPPQEPPPEGIDGVYDLSVGTYDVTVNVGPSFQSLRQEQREAMTAFVQAYPPSFPMIGDLLVKAMDWPGSQQISERMKKLLPPGIAEDGPDGQPAPPAPPPELLQELEQMKAALNGVTAELDEAKMTIQAKQIEAQSAQALAQLEWAAKTELAQLDAKLALAKIQAQMASTQATLADTTEQDIAVLQTGAQERIATLQADVDLAIAKAKIESDEAVARLKAAQAADTARIAAASRPKPSSDRKQS